MRPERTAIHPAWAAPVPVRRPDWRRLWALAHLWLGLVAGTAFVLIGLSGSLLAFREEIDAWLNPALYRSTGGCRADAATGLDAALKAIETHLPEGAEPASIAFPGLGRETLRVEYRIAIPGTGEFNRHDLFVDPCGGGLLGSRAWEDLERPWLGPWVAVATRLHTSLLLDRPEAWTGTHAVAFLAVALSIALGSGLYLWWPRPGRWRRAFAVKRGTGTGRLVYDLHRVGGAGAVPLLLLALFTGASLYSPWHGMIADGVKLLSPGTRLAAESASRPFPGGVSLTPQAGLALAEAALPDGLPASLDLPIGPTGTYRLTRIDADGVPVGVVELDRYGGEILDLRQAGRGTAGETFLANLFPWHTGRAFGLSGRCLVAALGLVPAALYLTGFLHWRRKRPARKSPARTQTTTHPRTIRP